MLRVMIVDDEELSIRRLTRILAESEGVDVCRTFLNSAEAYDYAKSNPVDIAFLDISMPEISGMNLSGLLQELDDAMDIVFVTGYDTFAVEAFERSALDYLLKPVTVERVAKTLGKARKKRHGFAPSPSLEVKLFNGLKILRPAAGAGPIKLRSPKTEELFAFLLCKRSVSREEIADTLWNGLEPEKAFKNLNSTLYYIRKAINEGKTGSCIVAGKNDIRIEESAVACDLYLFEQLLIETRQTPETSSANARRAEALYTGELLKGKAYEWAEEYARRIEQEYIRLLEQAARRCRDLGDTEAALRYYKDIMKLDALREDIVFEIIRLYVELGRPHEALKLYGLLELQLQQELGVLPSRKLREWMQTLT